MLSKNALSVLGAVLIIFLASSSVWAVDKRWTGASSTAYQTADNWVVSSTGGATTVPSASDNIYIPGGLTNYPSVNGNPSRCLNMTVDNGAIVYCNVANRRLDVSGNVLILAGGQLSITLSTSRVRVTGSYSNYGTLTITEGDLVLLGTTTNCRILTDCVDVGKTIKFLRAPGSNTGIADNVTVGVSAPGNIGFQLNNASARFYMGNGSKLITYDNWTITAGALFYCNDTYRGTVVLRGTGNVPAYDFYNLTIEGDFSLTRDTYVYGNLEIASTGNLAAGAYKLYVYGNWVNNGSFNAGTGEVQFINTPATVITGTTAFNIVRFGDGTNTKSITLSGSADIRAINTLEIKANTALNGSPTAGPNANLTIPSGCIFTVSGTWQPQQGTFFWQGVDPTNLPALTNGFYNLTIESSGNVTPNGALSVGNNLYIKSGTLQGGSGLTHNIGGDWIQDGSFSAGTSTIRLTGSDCEILKS
ncbi:MAG: hypothetical protein AB1599_06775, partial [Planctomycetota bacterium]